MTSAASDAFDAFVRDAARLVDDPHAIAERLRPLLGAGGWLAPEHQRGSAQGYRQHLLHVSPCRRLSVVALVWLPGQRTPIHDHVSWCVVGVHRGEEHETHYREVDRDGRRGLLPVGEVVAGPGHVEALVPPAANIHAVTASGAGKTISIHVYGADIEARGTSILRTFEGHEVLHSRRGHTRPRSLEGCALPTRSRRRPTPSAPTRSPRIRPTGT
jgi:predicted metal-dependent enzyme (double-stranded beta helix superfamily)